MSDTVQFYYDFGSPNAYLAHRVIPQIAARIDANFQYLPILLDGLFKLTGNRVFQMAPLHHHYEKKGYAESTIVIRFWIIAVILALAGLATLKLR